jgi:hypothetical protein
MTEMFHEIRRGGILVAVPEAELGREMGDALAAAGFNVHPMPDVEELVALVASALDGSNRLVLPEVFVVDDRFLHVVGVDLKAALEAIGCGDGLIVIVSGDWPDNVPHEPFEDVSCLHRPFPMALFVEEVASLATPVSMRAPPLKHCSRMA